MASGRTPILLQDLLIYFIGLRIVKDLRDTLNSHLVIPT